MDIVEDFVAVLHVVLDYIGIDADDLGDYLQDLNARQRAALLRICRALANKWDQNVTQPRLHAIQYWHRWRSDIRHRSLVRIIGTSLPLKAPRRFHINKHLLRPRRRHDSLDSNLSSLSFTSTVTTMNDDRELVWVEEELGEDCVRVRACARDDMDDCDSAEEIDPSYFDVRPGASSPMSSTMISSVSLMSSCDPAAMTKIAALEDELTNLRQQIAGLVLSQEQLNKSQAVTSIILPQSEIVTTPVCPQPPPPPPPPPCPIGLPPLPPPVPSQTFTPVAPESGKDSFQVDSKKNLDSNHHEKFTPEINKTNDPPTLSDVLKGLSSVKLRSIQRSPGGTPLKSRPPLISPNNCNDPASLIAQALKKKFAHRQFNSPDVDKENDTHEFSSADENSPYYNGENHFARKIKRKSLLFHDKRKSSGPLTEINI